MLYPHLHSGRGIWEITISAISPVKTQYNDPVIDVKRVPLSSAVVADEQPVKIKKLTPKTIEDIPEDF